MSYDTPSPSPAPTTPTLLRRRRLRRQLECMPRRRAQRPPHRPHYAVADCGADSSAHPVAEPSAHHTDSAASPTAAPTPEHTTGVVRRVIYGLRASTRLCVYANKSVVGAMVGGWGRRSALWSVVGAIVGGHWWNHLGLLRAVAPHCRQGDVRSGGDHLGLRPDFRLHVRWLAVLHGLHVTPGDPTPSKVPRTGRWRAACRPTRQRVLVDAVNVPGMPTSSIVRHTPCSNIDCACRIL